MVFASPLADSKLFFPLFVCQLVSYSLLLSLAGCVYGGHYFLSSFIDDYKSNSEKPVKDAQVIVDIY